MDSGLVREERMSEKDELNQVGQPQSDDDHVVLESADPPPNVTYSDVPPDPIGLKFSILQILLLAFISIVVVFSLTLNIVWFINLDNISVEEGVFSKDVILVICVMMLVSVLATASAFWMYYVKSVMLKDGPALVPEKWGRTIDALNDEIKDMQESSSSALDQVLHQSNHQSEQADTVITSFLTMQTALDNRDKEIARLKKGYDAVIFKRFLNRFIRVDRALFEIVNETPNGDNEKDMRYLKRLMQDALDECSVERFSPEIGSDFRQASEGVGDDPKTVNTEDIDLDFTVASVDSEGYVIRGEEEGEHLQVIVPAKVSIYRIQAAQSSEGKD